MAVKKTKQVTESPAPVVKPKSGRTSAADSLDNLIHERARLSLISTLAAHNSLSFSELKELLQMTDGNLSVQARRLEEAGYISCEKSFVGRTPRTEYALTDSGRAALKRYVAHMEALIKSMKQG
ncbi:MAG: transcriptional regulator [Pseudohongiella sp.]|nr:transcriptional regulator [Pseudohongiella sp.]MDO9520231.1 transcriptional regulator [Pseudohongiella sp.]